MTGNTCRAAPKPHSRLLVKTRVARPDLQRPVVTGVTARVECELGHVVREDRARAGVQIPGGRLTAVYREDARAIGVCRVLIARDGETHAIAVGLDEDARVAFLDGPSEGESGEETQQRERGKHDDGVAVVWGSDRICKRR
jgi:hypothetical protein